MSLTNNLSDKWDVKPLGEACKTIKGKKPKNTGPASTERTVPYINIKAFESGQPEEFAAPGDYPTCERDDVLIVWDGARAGLSGRAVPGYIGSTLAKVYSDVADNRYLFYFLQSQYGRINSRTKGVGIPHVDPTIFNNIPFPIASEDRQQRIVAEIEKQFSRLDEAVAGLKRVKANLKRYKAAVLKAAVEGKLTEDWRKQHPDVEPAGKLLERILAERRAKWTGRREYREPAALDTSALPDLPDRWGWATMPQLGELNRGKSKHRPRNDPKLFGGPYPFIQTGDVKRSGGFVRSHNQTYNESGLAQSRLWPAGTLCITIAANIAETGILTYPACFPDSVVGFLFDGAPATVRFIDLFFRTEREEIARVAPATAQKNINLEILSEVAIPLPPLEEQKQIVAEVEGRLSVLEKLEVAVEANLTRADRLRQAILARAFAGKLVNSALKKTPDVSYDFPIAAESPSTYRATR